MLLLETNAIKAILIEEYSKNNDIYTSCKLVEDDFTNVELLIAPYDNHYKILVYSSINNNIITEFNIPKK